MSAQPVTGPDCALRATAVGRALDALEPEDDRLLDEHLPHCGACREALRESWAVAAWLAVAVPATEPPPALRARVLAEAADLPVLPGVPVTRPPRADGPDVPDSRAGVEDADPVVPPHGTPAGGPASTPPPARPPRSARPPQVPRPPQPVPAAARRTQRWGLLAVAAVVLGVVILSARALLPATAVDTASPAAPSAVLADRAARIVQGAEVADPAGHQATLSDPTGRPLAVVVDDAGGARVVPLALPAAPSGSEYFLWRVAGSSTQPMGVVDATSVSRADVPGPASEPVTAYAISREAAGSRPTEPAVLVARGPTA